MYIHSYLSNSETFIYRQLMDLAENFKIDVLSQEFKNLQAFPYPHRIGIPSKNIFEKILCRLSGRYVSPGQLQAVSVLLKNYDLFLVHFGHIAADFDRIANDQQIPLIAFFWGWDASSWLNVRKNQERLSHCNFKAVFCNSSTMQKKIQIYLKAGTPIYVVYNGISLKQFPFRERTAIKKGVKFLQVSRFSPKKGHEITVKVFKRYVSEVDSEARLIFAGAGSTLRFIRQLVDQLGLSAQVNFLENVAHHEIPDLMSSADIFLHHSITDSTGDQEGVPTSMIEAAASGLPIVSTFHSGIPELIRDKESGFLVNEHDEEHYFRVLKDLSGVDLASVTRFARQTVENSFNGENTIKELNRLLNQLVSTSKSQS